MSSVSGISGGPAAYPVSAAKPKASVAAQQAAVQSAVKDNDGDSDNGKIDVKG